MKVGIAVSAAMILLITGTVQSANAADQQWYLTLLDAARAHALSQGDGVVVAVIDSGVDAGHPDLSGSVLPGIDLLNPPASPDGRVDSDGHGTRMAGVIAG